MRKLLLPALFAALLPACGANDQGALDEYDDVSNAEKADTLYSSSTYYTARQDFRRCLYPLCGGMWVKRANRAQTLCADGNYASECYVADANFSASGLSGEAAQQFKSLFQSGQGVVRGRIARKYFSGFGYLGVITSVPVTSQYDNGVWRAASTTASTEPHRLVKSSGIVCITTPCPSLHQAWLNIDSSYNRQYHSNLVSLNLNNVAASALDKEIAYNLSSQRLLTQGKLASVRGGYELVASQFYLPYKAPAAGACVTGGCSGTICQDENDDPIFTTCEWRPEYACYRQYGHCERQGDGSCGWSSTRDFLACLDNPPTF